MTASRRPDTADETTAAVLDILGRVLLVTPEELAKEPLLGAYNWDSITTLEALVALESAFAVEIDLRDLHAQRRVDELIDLVRRSRDAR
jgi:acyl carrier protein